MAARVTIYTSVLRLQTGQIANRVLKDFLDEVQTQAKLITIVGPYTQGELSRSIQQSSVIPRGDTYSGDVYSRLHYAKYVHNGTKPHIIRPRRPDGMLRFYWRKVNANVSFRSVNHPGQKGKNFLVGPMIRISARHGWVVYTREI